jgi:hypothetical protein
MKLSLFIVGILVATAGCWTAAQAQTNYPWCAQYGGSAGGVQNCGFVSFDQCMDTLRGMGGFCNQNTQYVPPPGPHPSGVARKSRYRENS